MQCLPPCFCKSLFPVRGLKATSTLPGAPPGYIRYGKKRGERLSSSIWLQIRIFRSNRKCDVSRECVVFRAGRDWNDPCAESSGRFHLEHGGSMIQRMEARQLSSSKEWSLISNSLPPAVKTLSVSRLKSNIGRAGKLRQKYWDLYRRQTISSKSRVTGKPSTRLNARTLRKKRMFDEVIDRLRLQLGKISETAETAENPTPLHRRKSAKTGKRSASSKLAQKRNERRTQSLKRRAASPASLKTASRRAAGYVRRHSHVAASGRRRQSKRDSRR